MNSTLLDICLRLPGREQILLFSGGSTMVPGFNAPTVYSDTVKVAFAYAFFFFVSMHGNVIDD